jgi:hypothetical protein
LRKPGPWGLSSFWLLRRGCWPDEKQSRREIATWNERSDAWGHSRRQNPPCVYDDNAKQLVHDIVDHRAEMLAEAGAHFIQPFTSNNPPGLVIHERAPRAMGKRSLDVVLNAPIRAGTFRNCSSPMAPAWLSTACQNLHISYMGAHRRERRRYAVVAGRGREFVKERREFLNTAGAIRARRDAAARVPARRTARRSTRFGISCLMYYACWFR